MIKKPQPPEGRIICNFCGHVDKESKYKHTCWMGIVCSTVLIIAAITPVLFFVSLFFGVF